MAVGSSPGLYHLEAQRPLTVSPQRPSSQRPEAVRASWGAPEQQTDPPPAPRHTDGHEGHSLRTAT